MPRFKYYNIQLLPLDTEGTRPAGRKGYQELFQLVKERTASARRAKRLERIAGTLRGDMFLAPYSVEILDSYAQGTLVKFDLVESVKNLYTKEKKYEGEAGDSSKSFEFDFVFDYDMHIMAIEFSRGLPQGRPLCASLAAILDPVAEERFPAYTVTVTELTAAESLEKLRHVDGFQRIRIGVTFSNSGDFDDAWAKEIEQDFRENDVHSVVHSEKSAKKSFMKALTKISAGLLGLATKYGNAEIRYIQGGESDTYHMADFPVIEEVAVHEEDARNSYLSNVKSSIRRADQRARVGKEVLSALRGSKK